MLFISHRCHPVWKKSLSQRARRALGYGLGSFVLFQLLLVGLLGWLAPWLRDPMHGLKEHGLQEQLASAPPATTSVVMLGSSRTAYGFNAAAAARTLSQRRSQPVVVYNFGLPGAGPCATLLSLRRLLDDGIRPDLVLLEVVPFRLGEPGLPADLAEKYLPTASLRRAELPVVQRFAGQRRTLSPCDWWLSWCVPCYHHRFALVSHSAPTLLHYLDRLNALQGRDHCGWVELPGSTGDANAIRGSIEAHFAGFDDNGPSVSALDETLRLCRAAGVRVALVLMPEGPTFRSWYPPSVLTKIDSVLGRLADNHAVAVIDARAWIGEDGFRDSHHLLSAAATRFSEQLARVLTDREIELHIHTPAE